MSDELLQANLVMADDAWHDSEYVAAADYDALRTELTAERERADRAEAERNDAEARAEAAQDECQYAQDLVGRQYNLLRGVVNALRGPPPDLTSWSHHDAPEVAAAVAAERDALRERVVRLTQLLANVFDNLNDTPINDEWARLTCDRISAALEVNHDAG